jgi:hypothetical protein
VSDWVPIPNMPGWFTKPAEPPELTPEIKAALAELQEKFDQIDLECDAKNKQRYNPSSKGIK